MVLSLELVTVPVSDVDRAKAFDVDQVGFSADQDRHVHESLRFVQLTTPGSACSIAIGTGLVDSQPGSLKGLQVVVEDANAAHAFLRERGAEVSDIKSTPGAASASSPTPTATAGLSRNRRIGADDAAHPAPFR